MKKSLHCLKIVHKKYPIVLGQRMKEYFNKTLGTSVIYSTMSPPSQLLYPF